MRTQVAGWMCVCAVLTWGCALDSGDSNGAGIGGSAGESGSSGTGGSGGGVCSLPFDPGPCDAAFQRWAFVPALGACFPHTWGGCGGNGNNFVSQEECEDACGLGPITGACPPNRVNRDVCVQCGLGGGCAASVFTCATVCSGSDDCPSGTATPIGCIDNVCQAIGCI